MRGEEIVLRSGEVGIAIRATLSSTPLFEPVQINGRWLIDGAAVNPVPIAPLHNEVDIIIASSVIVPIEKRKQHAIQALLNLLNLAFNKETIMEASIMHNPHILKESSLMISRMLILTITFSILFASLTSFMLAAPGCQVPSIINTTTSLTPSECPQYIQTTNIVVREDATLLIEPGTIIRVDGLYVITVDGQLVARGTTENPIHITSNQASPEAGDWGHILFKSTSRSATFDESGNYEAGSILQHVKVEYGGGISSDSKNGVIIADNAAPFIDHLTIQHNKEAAIRVRGGILFSNQDIKVSNNLITSNGDGSCIIDIDNLAFTTVEDNIVRANTGAGICVSFGDSIINRNVVEDNVGWGIGVNNSDATLISNMVMNNSEGGISHADAFARISNNTIVGNQGTNGAGLKVTSFGLGTKEVFIHANTILSNTASNSGGGLYLVCTTHPYYIQENVIRGNQVSDKDGQGGAVMLTIPCDDARFTFNDIYDNQAALGSALYNGNSNSFSDIDARLNYWGSTNETEIEQAIYHQVDSTRLGFVDYTTYLREPISQLSRLHLPFVTR